MPGLIHFANSAAIAARPETWADMVRPGAILYGYHPGFDPPERRKEFETKLQLRPVMSLRTRIINVRCIAAGEGVGYDASWVAQRPSRVAVVAAGYHDGVHRSLGNRRKVRDSRPSGADHRHRFHGRHDARRNRRSRRRLWAMSLRSMARMANHTYPANVVARSIGTVTSDLLSGVGPRVPRMYLCLAFK